MADLSYRKRVLSSSFFLLLLSLLWLVAGCKDDDEGETKFPEQPLNIFLYNNTITITDITGIPEGVTFNRVVAKVTGECWDVIDVIEAAYQDGKAVLTLPAAFVSEKLQPVMYSDTNVCGFWRAVSDNPDALVAGLGEGFTAFLDDVVVGRIYLTDWLGEVTSDDKTYIYYHYTDRPFTLSGYNASYRYAAAFKAGWNAYANVNVDSPGTSGNLCTTTIAEEARFYWRFESWVYNK